MRKIRSLTVVWLNLNSSSDRVGPFTILNHLTEM